MPQENLKELNQQLGKSTLHDHPPANPDLLDLLRTTEINQSFQKNYQNILLFDLLYNQVIEALPTIANELKGTNQISQKSVEQLFEKTVEGAIKIVCAQGAGGRGAPPPPPPPKCFMGGGGCTAHPRRPKFT